jgi:sulfhydrogenase subunit gamma (sulfur reductase)
MPVVSPTKRTRGFDRSIYVPEMARLVAVERVSPTEKRFVVMLDGKRPLDHKPGQFVMVSVMGVGEAPISVSSSPTRGPEFELIIRKTGVLTDYLHEMSAGDPVGIRGPFGHGFDAEALEGKDILFVGGGIGLVPLRSLIEYVFDRRTSFGKATLVIGARNPEELMFRPLYDEWAANPDTEMRVAVDRPGEGWSGHVGVITTLLPDLQVDTEKTIACVCGPPVMYKYVLLELQGLGLPDSHVFFSLERRMKCGVGKCGHCQVNGVYVCRKGPVFNYMDIRHLPEAL